MAARLAQTLDAPACFGDISLLTEDEVVDLAVSFLEEHGYKIDGTCKNTARGDDIAATFVDGSRLFVECKGAISRQGNELDAWLNSAMAVFGAIKESEQLRPEHRHAIAVPDIESYRKTLGPLNAFFAREKITLLWVQASGSVSVEGASNHLLQGRRP